VSEGPDTVQDKYKEIEGELKQLKDDGEIQYKEFKEEFKDLFENEDGLLLDKDEQLEDREIDAKLKDVNESLKAFAEPDEKEQTSGPKGVVKK